MKFKDKVVIITGGAQGIGKALAKYFLEQKAKVVIFDKDKEAGKETEKILSILGDILFVQGSTAKESDVKKTVKSTLAHFKKIDILINNAGYFLEKPLQKLSLQAWNDLIGTNLTGAFLFSKYGVAALKKTKGAIINIASTRALMSEPHTEAYAASKGGLVALTHALSISLGPDIRVNCISPGWIETSAWKKKNKRHTPQLSPIDLSQHPVGRVGSPEDIASIVGYVASEEASFITGANFIVDGGMTRKMIYAE